MKVNIEQIVDTVILDNKEYIKDFGGNVKDYLLTDFCNEDQGHCFYLTESEIELWESGEDERVPLINEIYEFLEGYDVDVDQYLGIKI